MAILNITYLGISADYNNELPYDMADEDIKRVAMEVINSGEIPGMSPGLQHPVFADFVVDKFDTAQGQRIYLRPKVPFGGK